MKCYLGGNCIHSVEMFSYLKSHPEHGAEQDFIHGDFTELYTPFGAKKHCMEIDCSQFDKICKLADEYRALRAELSEKQTNPK